MTKITDSHINSEKINNQKLNNLYTQLQEILDKIKQTKIPDQDINFINREIEQINSTIFSSKALLKLLKQKQDIIIKHLEKEHKIVPKKHYTNLWLAIGMAAFGLPLGLLLGLLLGNMGLMAIGLPIGLGLGSVVGSSMDKKAFEEGRQLDVDIKF